MSPGFLSKTTKLAGELLPSRTWALYANRSLFTFNMLAKGLSRGLLLLQLLASLVPANASSSKTPLYKDVNAPVEKRVKDLLGRMTIEDKMAQLMQGSFLIP
jgi:hypothetical protein